MSDVNRAKEIAGIFFLWFYDRFLDSGIVVIDDHNNYMGQMG